MTPKPPPHYLTPTKASMAQRKDQLTTRTPTTPTTRGNSATTRRTMTPLSPPNKILYLIRHGESMGQAAKKLGMDRRRDERLRDAALTNYGIWQAQRLNETFNYSSIELIVSSPLRRALHTALLGFAASSTIPILIHYDLAELGSRVPENMPRSIEEVLDDLKEHGIRNIDTATLKPSVWPPPRNAYHGKMNQCHAIQRAMQYLYTERDEQCIAVVCHYNVIREILSKADIRPENADPIACELQSNGKVVVLRQRETMAVGRLDFAEDDDDDDDAMQIG